MLLRKLVAKLSGNRPVQRLLEYSVFVCQYFQGIGSGTSVGDSGEQAVMARLLESGRSPVIFDAGANKGQFLQLVLDAVGGRTAAIHCFEPSGSAFAELSRVAAGDDRVQLNHVALGRESGEGQLFYDEQASGLASLSKRNLDHIGIDFNQSETIRIETVDGYCQKHGIDSVDLLKMDVEGHEFDLLQGAESLFARNAVGMALFEFGGANIDTRTFFRDFYLFFDRHGMDIYRITPSGHFVPVSQYSEQCEQFRTTNFVCIRRDAV